MQIKHPRRILCLGGPNSGVLTLLKDLTGALPPPRTIPATTQQEPISPQTHQTTAGLTHTHYIKNAYYSALIPIWLDEPTATLADWKADFLTSEGGEVVKAVGAWIVVFHANTGSVAGHVSGAWGLKEVLEAMQAVKEVIAHAHGGHENSWDGVCLAVQVPSSFIASTSGQLMRTENDPDWEALCWDEGFEFISLEDSREGRDENSDIREWTEKKGLERIKEALETNEWSCRDEDDYDNVSEGQEMKTQYPDECYTGFEVEVHDIESDFRQLQLAMAAGVQDAAISMEQEASQVDELDDLMSKMMVIKDMSAHMPEAERKRFTARAVKNLFATN